MTPHDNDFFVVSSYGEKSYEFTDRYFTIDNHTTDLSILYETGHLVLGGRAVWALFCSSIGGRWNVSGGRLNGAFDPSTVNSFTSMRPS